MAVSNGFLAHIAELLAPLGSVSARKMFGGASLYCDGTIFAIVEDDVLYFKTDASSRLKFADEGLAPFVYEGQTGPVETSYWRAPERLFDEPDEMMDWAREALRVSAKGRLPTKRVSSVAGTKRRKKSRRD